MTKADYLKHLFSTQLWRDLALTVVNPVGAVAPIFQKIILLSLYSAEGTLLPNFWPTAPPHEHDYAKTVV